jgi:hypothetical protein
MKTLSKLLRRVAGLLPATKSDVRKILMKLSELKAQVDANVALEQSAVTLITGLSAQLKEIADDPAAIQALADELSSEATALSAAIVANTPAAPAPSGEAPQA